MNPNFNGVWKADLQKSKLLGPMPEALVAEIKEAGEELPTEMLITKGDGREDRLLFKGRTSGEEVTNVVQGVKMRSRLQWMSNELLIESRVNVGAPGALPRLLVALGRWSNAYHGTSRR